jgi:hypothetical protein
MQYETGQFLFPPRPEHVITSDMLGFYQSRGWVAQYKKNGTCTIIIIDPIGDVKFVTRHGKPHRAWSCPEKLKKTLSVLAPQKRWTVLVAEVLHSKTPTIKDTIYIHDIIVHQNVHLVGSSFAERQKILDWIIPQKGIEAYSHWEFEPGIWRAKNLSEGFEKAWVSIWNPKIDEGFVLKNPDATLKWCVRENSNSDWLVKVRYPTKNYQF